MARVQAITLRLKASYRDSFLWSEVIHIVHMWLPGFRMVPYMLSNRLFASTDYGVYEQDWAPVMLPNWDSRTTASGYDLFCIPAVTGRTANAEIWARALNHAVLVFPFFFFYSKTLIWQSAKRWICTFLSIYSIPRAQKVSSNFCGQIKLAPMKKVFMHESTDPEWDFYYETQGKDTTTWIYV